MENKSYKKIILLGITAFAFTFALSANAGVCDDYQIVPTCMSTSSTSTYVSTTNSSTTGQGTGLTWGNWLTGGSGTNGNGTNGSNGSNSGSGNSNKLASVASYVPDSVSASALKLRGKVVSDTPTSMFFQYGTDINNLNRETSHQAANSLDGYVVNNLTNLSPNTTYYYRLVADNASGRSVSNIMSVTTAPGNSNNNTVSGSTNTGGSNNVSSGTTANNNSSSSNNTVTSSNNTSSNIVKSSTASVANAATISNDTATIKPSTSVSGANLSASALSISGANSFLPDTVFEWICVFFLILVIILLIRQLRPKADHGHAVAHH